MQVSLGLLSELLMLGLRYSCYAWTLVLNSMLANSDACFGHECHDARDMKLTIEQRYLPDEADC
jgi:hypothetical protein